MTKRLGLAVVTGASAGIGAEFARQLRRRGYELVLVARRREKLDEVSAEVGGAQAIAADLADPAALETVAETLERLEPDLLINNAGFGTKGRFAETDGERQMEMHRLHVLATVRLSRAVLPAMVRRNAGGIINVASVASFGRSVSNVSYCATKAWMAAFSEGLYLEMRAGSPGVAIQALCPGFTYSEFHDVLGADRSAISPSLWLAADRVVRESLEGFDRKRLYVVPGWRYRWFVHIYPKLPTGFRLWLSGRAPHKKERV